MKCAVLSGGSRCPNGFAAADRLRRVLVLLTSGLLLCVLLGWTKDAHAYAWMIRHGYTKCETCHTDPSGGEALNHMGRVQSETLLSSDWGNQGVTSDAKLFYSLDEPDHFRAGGSVRAMGVYTLKNGETPSALRVFPMQLDAYGSADFGLVKAGGSIGLGKSKVGFNRAAQVTRAKDNGYALISRTHWLGFDLGQQWLLRLGRLNLPFGIRTSEHTLLVRSSTETDRESDQQHGVAISYSGGKFRGEGMFVLGNYQVAPDDFRERGFVGYLEYTINPKLAVGGSTLVLQSAKSLSQQRSDRTIRHAHGLTGRFLATDSLVLLGEVDVLKTSGRKLGYTGFVTGDYELFRGLHLAATGDVLDAGKREGDAPATSGSGKLTYDLWATVQWFFYTHWDLRSDFLLREGGGKLAELQVHTYF